MKLSRLVGLWLLTFVGCASFKTREPAGDSYKNYAELSAHEREGVDYKVTSTDRHAPVSVFAIHGGAIEPGSSEIASSLAGDSWNFYLFEGISESSNRRLHITSAQFDEPRALALANARVDFCISVHGFNDGSEIDKICLGGLNAKLKSSFVSLATRESFPAQLDSCENLRGEDMSNIVNLCKQQGLQLEISRSLRDKLKAQSELRSRLGDLVRRSIRTTE